MDLEQQQLDLRYSRLRLRVPKRERRLLASIAEVGQLVPIAVVNSDSDPSRAVVIDGFKRVRALRTLRLDLVRAVHLDLSEVEALLLYRAMRTTDGATSLEQAWLLQELQARFQLSMQQLARQFQKDPSWISRRLALASQLSEGLQREIRRGRIAPHTATKYLVPMARAKVEDCERMARAIVKHGFDTRDVGVLYAGWRDGCAVTRERLLDDPQLYLESRRALAEVGETLDPREGLLKDVEILGSVARRADRRLREAGQPELSAPDVDTLVAGLVLATRRIEQLTDSLQTLRQEEGA